MAATSDARARQLLLVLIALGVVLLAFITYRILTASSDDSDESNDAAREDTSEQRGHDDEEDHAHQDYPKGHADLDEAAPAPHAGDIAREFTTEFFTVDRSESEWLKKMEFYCSPAYFAQLEELGMEVVRPLTITGEPDILKSYTSHVVYSFPAGEHFTFVVTVNDTARGWKVTESADVRR